MPTCSRCGYDLRGIDSKNCPECGLPFYTFKVTFHDPVEPIRARPQKSRWLASFWIVAVAATLILSALLGAMAVSFGSHDEDRKYIPDELLWLIDFIGIALALGFPVLMASMVVTALELPPKAAWVTLGCTILLAIGAGALEAKYDLGLACLLCTDVLAVIGGVGVGLRMEGVINHGARRGYF